MHHIIEIRLDDLIARIDDHLTGCGSPGVDRDPEIVVSIKADADLRHLDDLIEHTSDAEWLGYEKHGRVAQVRSKFGEAFFEATWETDPNDDGISYSTLERKVPMSNEMTDKGTEFMTIIDKLGVSYKVRVQL